MVTAHQRIEVVLTFDTTFNLTQNQLRYINEHIADLVYNSINKGKCTSLILKEGLDTNDEVIISDNEYIFEFIANIKCDYSANAHMVNNDLKGGITWDTVEKIEDIDKFELMKLLKHNLLVGDFGMHIYTLQATVYDELFDLPPNSNI